MNNNQNNSNEKHPDVFENVELQKVGKTEVKALLILGHKWQPGKQQQA
jgi:hypothetical protein